MSETDRAPYRLVPLEDRHVAGMTRIFNEHVASGFAAYPEEPVGEDAMRALLAQTIDGLTVAAEADDGSLLGFGFLRPYSPQATFAQAAQITTFLDSSQLRRGIGTAVLRRLEDGARRRGVTKLLAHVSSRNPDSLAFHAARGFVECGRFPGIGRKWGKPFDVVWMIKSL